MKNIATITVARSDYSILKPVLVKIKNSKKLKLSLIAGGMHLLSEYGMTVNEIIKDGFKVDEQVDMLLSSDLPESISKSMGIGVMGFSQVFSRLKPDIILLMGDRFEMFSAAIASLPFNIPIAHIHGGELTYGAFDDSIRHAISKMSHLHYVATDEYAKRLLNMGEEPWRVTISGAPALDNINDIKFFTRKELEKKYQILIDDSTIVATLHPTTREFENTEKDTISLLNALSKINKNIIFTYPNADTNGKIIIDYINKFVSDNDKAWVVPNMGLRGYYSLLRQIKVMLGNSSSGIIEAASFGLPVVNIGSRQEGRACGRNVIHVTSKSDDIYNGIQKSLSSEFQNSLKGFKNIYSRGNASEIIVNSLSKIKINKKLMKKIFNDISESN